MTDSRLPAIEIKDVNVTLGGVSILTRVYTTIYQKEITALIGPNGAGKTTLLLAMQGLIPYTGHFKFHESLGPRPRIGYVPQHLEVDRGLPLTVIDYLSLKEQRRPLWLGNSKPILKKIISTLELVGASRLSGRPLSKLSGGEFQKVSLAMALLGDPQVILLDEPIAGVDVMGEEIFSELLVNLKKEKELTMVLVSHDLSLVNKYADQVICLNHCVHCQGKSAEVLTSETIARVFGSHMGLHDHAACLIPTDEEEGA